MARVAAVSPAVVAAHGAVDGKRRGTDKNIPQMILAYASCDDIFVDCAV